MKTSYTVLLLSVMLIGLKVVRPELTGILLLNSFGEPKNNIVRFWMEKFEYKILPEILTVNFKYLKLEGGDKMDLEILPADSTRTVCFLTPGSQTYEMVKDTLVIRSQRNLRDASYIKVYGNVESLDVVGGTEVLLGRVSQNTLRIHVKDRSKLKTMSPLLGKKDKSVMENISIKAAGESNVELRTLAARNISVDVNNSMVKYGFAVAADTMQVNLSGKSNVKAVDVSHKSGINTLIVSGNKTYFKPDSIGYGVRLVWGTDETYVHIKQ